MKALKNLVFKSFVIVALLSLHASAQVLPPGTGSSSTSSTTTTTTATTDTTTTSTTGTTTTPTTTTSPTTTPTTTNTTPTNTPPPAPTNNTQTDQTTTVNPNTETVTVTNPISSTTSSTTAAPTDNSDDGDTSGLGTGSIIGLSVAGGVAVIGIIGFFVWKFTRKRFTDLDGDEAIKWPDLNNTHTGDTHALPVKSTGRPGFGDTGSDGSLSRVNSVTNYSTPDFSSGGHDPYAVPPLPHLNPNQPYRDDPSTTGTYYDPYHGPVPGTIEQPNVGPEWAGTEAIPMNQMHSAGRMSPGPHAAYGGVPEHPYDAGAGRHSPGPYAAYGVPPGAEQYDVGRQSPGPYAAYGAPPPAGYTGRTSPGPHAAYGQR